jgi:hypothetical protein
MCGHLRAPAALRAEKEPPHPFYWRFGGAQSRSGRRGEENILDPTGTQTPTSSIVQPVASRYTDYAIPAPVILSFDGKYSKYSERRYIRRK